MGHTQNAVSVQRRDADAPLTVSVLPFCVGFDLGGDRIFVYGFGGGGLYCGWTCGAQIVELFAFNVQHLGG